MKRSCTSSGSLPSLRSSPIFARAASAAILAWAPATRASAAATRASTAALRARSRAAMTVALGTVIFIALLSRGRST